MSAALEKGETMHKSQLVPCHSESVRGPCSGLESEVWGGSGRQDTSTGVG